MQRSQQDTQLERKRRKGNKQSARALCIGEEEKDRFETFIGWVKRLFLSFFRQWLPSEIDVWDLMTEITKVTLYADGFVPGAQGEFRGERRDWRKRGGVLV